MIGPVRNRLLSLFAQCKWQVQRPVARAMPPVFYRLDLRGGIALCWGIDSHERNALLRALVRHADLNLVGDETRVGGAHRRKLSECVYLLGADTPTRLRR